VLGGGGVGEGPVGGCEGWGGVGEGGVGGGAGKKGGGRGRGLLHFKTFFRFLCCLFFIFRNFTIFCCFFFFVYFFKGVFFFRELTIFFRGERALELNSLYTAGWASSPTRPLGAGKGRIFSGLGLDARRSAKKEGVLWGGPPPRQPRGVAGEKRKGKRNAGSGKEKGTQEGEKIAGGKERGKGKGTGRGKLAPPGAGSSKTRLPLEVGTGKCFPRPRKAGPGNIFAEGNLTGTATSCFLPAPPSAPPVRREAA